MSGSPPRVEAKAKAQAQGWLAAILVLGWLLQAAAAMDDDCPDSDRCGDVGIPYPFGTKPGCFLPGFQVVCNETFSPPRPFLANPALSNMTGPIVSIQDTKDDDDGIQTSSSTTSLVELIDVSINNGQARVYAAFSFVCNTSRTGTGGGYWSRYQLLDTSPSSPFVLSNASNVLLGIGRGVYAQLDGAWPDQGYGSYMVTCISKVTPLAQPPTNGTCAGVGCCQGANDMSPFLRCSKVTAEPLEGSVDAETCVYAMLVERSWYNFSVPDMDDGDLFLRNNPRGVPVVLDFSVKVTAASSWCPAPGQPAPPDYACKSGNDSSSCFNVTTVLLGEDPSPGYRCKCRNGYHGNPYIPHGCQDIDECAIREQSPELQRQYPCSRGGTCVNTVGSYECPCRGWMMKGDGKTGVCTDQFPFAARVAVGIIGGSLAVIVFSLTVLLVIEKKKTRKFFMKNGGHIIMKNVDSIKIFNKKEIKRITKNYSIILGKGAFGEVYGGSLDDEHQVAVKRSIKVNEKQKEQFANEIIVQSRIIHKNIVKLIGCCLEVDVPMLVYEFVSRGTLEETLHGCTKAHLSLDERLVIAANSADGLAYMHFKTPTIILHGDVKPSNILLDDNLFPKISDFGISKLIPIDKGQHDGYVIGDRIYMDPVYRETGLLTTKSDVYSFGVVLLELITRKQAKDGNLIGSFVATYTRENAQNEFDKDITGENEIEVLHNIARLAIECLNANVDQRPDMMEVAERLQNISKDKNK